MTDLDVIKHIEDEAKIDAQFTARTDLEYLAYLKGQKVGASRAMAYLRETRVLKPTVTDGTIYYRF